MAEKILMKHKESGLITDGFYGFSWTTLLFGALPALFRGDFATFLVGFAVLVILAIATFGIGAYIAAFIWSFQYNKYYTRRLLERGYVLAGTEVENAKAASVLGVVSPSSGQAGVL